MRARSIAIAGATAAAAIAGAMVITSKHRQFRRSTEAARFRDLGGGRSVLSPWSGRYSDYAEFGGFRVPSSVEVTWDLTDGPFSYARFNVIALEYNVPEPF